MRDGGLTKRLQSKGGHHSWTKHGAEICPLCGGTGVLASSVWREKGHKGGVRRFLVSLQLGQLSMSERGKRGGRPKALTIEDIERRQAAPGPSHRCSGLPPPAQRD